MNSKGSDFDDYRDYDDRPPFRWWMVAVTVLSMTTGVESVMLITKHLEQSHLLAVKIDQNGPTTAPAADPTNNTPEIPGAGGDPKRNDIPGPLKMPAVAPDRVSSDTSDPSAKLFGHLRQMRAHLDELAAEAAMAKEEGGLLADKHRKLLEVHNSGLKYFQAMADGQLRLRLDRGQDKEEELDLDLAYVEPGTFPMGRTRQEVTRANEHAPAAHESSFPRHEVRIANGFFMGVTEVTNRQFWAFMKARRADAQTKPGDLPKWPAKPDSFTKSAPTDDLWSAPATQISWIDAMQFCKWASARTGVIVRLPTEIEWEYAARGRGGMKFARADGKDYENSTAGLGKPQGVMSDEVDISWCGVRGLCWNVSEWCLDKFDEHTYEKRKKDAQDAPFQYLPYRASLPDSINEPSTGSDRRVFRGGSYADFDASWCEASSRRWKMQKEAADYIGFRVVVAFRPADIGLAENPAVDSPP